MVRVFAFHQYSLGLVKAWCHILIEFVVGCWLALRGFLGCTVFLFPWNPTSPDSNSTRIDDRHESQVDMTSFLNIIIVNHGHSAVFHMTFPFRLLVIPATQPLAQLLNLLTSQMIAHYKLSSWTVSPGTFFANLISNDTCLFVSLYRAQAGLSWLKWVVGQR